MKKLIAGLGNPENKYEKTRHNTGFMVVNNIINMLDIKYSSNRKLKADLVEYGDFIFMKPQSYMNTSGISVAAVASFYKIMKENIYIIHDDADILFGEYKIRFSAGSAGHHGVESIIERLNSKDFWRVRVGIGRQESANYDIQDWVLSKFTPDELLIVEDLSERIKNDLRITN